jgi:hypothetical protein
MAQSDVRFEAVGADPAAAGAQREVRAVCVGQLTRWPGPDAAGSPDRWSTRPDELGQLNPPEVGDSGRWVEFGEILGSGCGAGGSELGADKHQRRIRVVWLGNGCKGEVSDHGWAEDEAVGRAAKLEVAEFLALGEVVAGPDM